MEETRSRAGDPVVETVLPARPQHTRASFKSGGMRRLDLISLHRTGIAAR